MTTTFTDINSNYENKKITHWMKAANDNLSYVTKNSGQAEVQQASSLGYGLWRRFGFGPYGYLTITNTIKKVAEKEIDDRIALLAVDAEVMGKKSAFVLKDLKEIINWLQGAHTIQQIDVQQKALIKSVEGKFCSHFGLLRSSLTIFGWHVTKFMVNVPSAIMGLFDQKVRDRNVAMRYDIQKTFIDLIFLFKEHSIEIWYASDKENNKVSVNLYTFTGKQVILIQKNDEKLLAAEFWVDRQVLQIKFTQFKEDAEAIALTHRLFTKIVECKGLSLKEPLPESKCERAYQQNRYSTSLYGRDICLDTIIQGAHKISKLTYLLSITTLVEAANHLNAKN